MPPKVLAVTLTAATPPFSVIVPVPLLALIDPVLLPLIVMAPGLPLLLKLIFPLAVKTGAYEPPGRVTERALPVPLL